MSCLSESMCLKKKKLFKITLIIPDGPTTGTYEVLAICTSSENLAKDLALQEYKEKTGKTEEGIKIFAEEREEVFLGVMKNEPDIVRGGTGNRNLISMSGGGGGYVQFNSDFSPFDF